MKKLLRMFLLSTSGLLLLTGCQSSTQSTSFEFGKDLVFVEDKGNYRIDLEKSSDVVKSKYQKIANILDDKSILDDIVAVTTTTANILNEIGITPTGAPESLSLNKDIANAQYNLKKKGKTDKTKVLNIGSALSPNIEAIIELAPELVLYSDAMPKTAFLKKIETGGVKTDALGQSDYIDMFVLLQRINELTEGKNQKSVTKMNEMVEALQATNKLVAKAKTTDKTVAILQIAENSVSVNNDKTVLGSIVSALKLKNVFASSENGQLNKEKLLSLNPDYIIYYSHGMGTSALTNFEKTLNAQDSLYRELKALKYGHAFQVSSDDFVFSSSVDFDIIKTIKFLAATFYE